MRSYYGFGKIFLHERGVGASLFSRLLGCLAVLAMSEAAGLPAQCKALAEQNGSGVQLVEMGEASKSGLCAAGCAYAVLRLEGHADLTPTKLFGQLPGADRGRVLLSDLITLFRKYHLHATTVRADDLSSVISLARDDRTYVILLTLAPQNDGTRPLDHTILYLRTAPNGDLFCADPPNVVRYRPSYIEERWRGRYALVVSQNPLCIGAHAFRGDERMVRGLLVGGAVVILVALGLAGRRAISWGTRTCPSSSHD